MSRVVTAFVEAAVRGGDEKGQMLMLVRAVRVCVRACSARRVVLCHEFEFQHYAKIDRDSAKNRPRCIENRVRIPNP